MRGASGSHSRVAGSLAIIYVFCQIQTLLIFAKKKLLPRDLPQRGKQTLPAEWADATATGFHPLHTLVSSPAPLLVSLSLSLARLIRWHVCKMARCVSGIHFHVCQKSNESSSKTFRAGQGVCPLFLPLPHSKCVCLPVPPT